MGDSPHTIVSTERAWAPRVLISILIATVAVIGCAIASRPPSPPRIMLLMVSALPLAIVYRHLIGGEVSVGLIPIAIAAVGPAGLAAYLASGMRLALIGAIAGFGMAGFMLAWFQRMALACRPVRDVADSGTAIVLGCAVKDGQPSTTLQLRLDAAIALWRRHPGIRIIVTGGVSDARERSEAAVMADCLAAAGVPSEQVILEDLARNTEENLANARRIIEDGHLDAPVWLVTSDYHMWRALMIAQGTGIDAIPCAARTPSSSRLVQWCREVLVICFGS